jgi:hypothetical protein
MARTPEFPTPATSDPGGGLFTVISVVVLVGTEIIGAALAAGWALAGLFELGTTLAYVLMAIFTACALSLLYMFARSALRVESAGGRT